MEKGEGGGARTRLVPMHGRRMHGRQAALWSGDEGAAWHAVAGRHLQRAAVPTRPD